jgi:hypothetical protein
MQPPHNAANLLARCPEPGCPFRWRHGKSRPCSEHRPDNSNAAERLAAWQAAMAAPGEHGEDDGVTDGHHSRAQPDA